MKCSNVDCWGEGEIEIKIYPPLKCGPDLEKHDELCLQEVEGHYCFEHASQVLKIYSEYVQKKVGK